MGFIRRNKASYLQKTIGATSSSVFSNLFYVVHLLMLISVTSAVVKHSNFALKLVKTVMRSTIHQEHHTPGAPYTRSTIHQEHHTPGAPYTRSTKHQDRLNALVLRHVDKDIKLDIQAIVIDKYSRKRPRRMLLINPLSSQ